MKKKTGGKKKELKVETMTNEAAVEERRDD